MITDSVKTSVGVTPAPLTPQGPRAHPNQSCLYSTACVRLLSSFPFLEPMSRPTPKGPGLLPSGVLPGSLSPVLPTRLPESPVLSLARAACTAGG